MKHVRIESKFYNLDTFKKEIDVNSIDLDSELVDLNYKVASLIFCHFWRSIAIIIRSALVNIRRKALLSSVGFRKRMTSRSPRSFICDSSALRSSISELFDFW